MLLADSCFNFTHESFNKDLDSVINDSLSSNIRYLFCPASREVEVENILKTCTKYLTWGWESKKFVNAKTY